MTNKIKINIRVSSELLKEFDKVQDSNRKLFVMAHNMQLPIKSRNEIITNLMKKYIMENKI